MALSHLIVFLRRMCKQCQIEVGYVCTNLSKLNYRWWVKHFTIKYWVWTFQFYPTYCKIQCTIGGLQYLQYNSFLLCNVMRWCTVNPMCTNDHQLLDVAKEPRSNNLQHTALENCEGRNSWISVLCKSVSEPGWEPYHPRPQCDMQTASIEGEVSWYLKCKNTGCCKTGGIGTRVYILLA